ncbi:hypothetical protein [Tatumella citrea]|uniref:hypothetical protein n=1 Tax=Tatumella citrea TaxID=53336 RepID=UPI0012FC3051|nr:hypothetical protein [Tatumella citrea]
MTAADDTQYSQARRLERSLKGVSVGEAIAEENNDKGKVSPPVTDRRATEVR